MSEMYLDTDKYSKVSESQYSLCDDFKIIYSLKGIPKSTVALFVLFPRPIY